MGRLVGLRGGSLTLVVAAGLTASGALASTAAAGAASNLSSCSKASLSASVETVNAAAASLLGDLERAGASNSRPAEIVIVLDNGKQLKLTLNGAKFTFSGTEVPAACKIRQINSPIEFTWSFSAAFSVAQNLAISGLPPRAKIAVICKGRGCPFARRSFSPAGPKLSLTSEFAGRRLRPTTTVTLKITAANQIGKVAVFTVRSGQQPTLTELCLPPGASGPSACQ